VPVSTPVATIAEEDDMGSLVLCVKK